MEAKITNRLQNFIVITGTESTGKTELAEWLGYRMGVPVIQDVTRQYCNALQRDVTADDVYRMAKEIIQNENSAWDSASVIISDNCLLNIRIWLRYRNWAEPEWLTKEIDERMYGFYLLCYPDVPWQHDPLRNNPHDRLVLYQQFETELQKRHAKYLVVKGKGEARYITALKAIDAHLAK